MAGRASGSGTGRSWRVWALCAAAVSLVLVEAGTGVEYVGTGLGQIAVNVLGWVPPALNLILLHFAEQSVQHLGPVELMWRVVPLGVVGFLLVFLGLSVSQAGRRTGETESAKGME